MSSEVNPGNWPDASRRGVPLHPERDGWHEVIYQSDEPARLEDADPERALRLAWRWHADSQHWDPDVEGDERDWESVEDYTFFFTYVGPLFTSSEHIAALAAAEQLGREAAFERAALLCQEIGDSGTAEDCESAIRSEAYHDAFRARSALPSQEQPG